MLVFPTLVPLVLGPSEEELVSGTGSVRIRIMSTKAPTIKAAPMTKSDDLSGGCKSRQESGDEGSIIISHGVGGKPGGKQKTYIMVMMAKVMEKKIVNVRATHRYTTEWSNGPLYLK